MEDSINKLISFVFTQGSGYITLAACFAMFYFHTKEFYSSLLTKLCDKIGTMEDKLDKVLTTIETLVKK